MPRHVAKMMPAGSAMCHLYQPGRSRSSQTTLPRALLPPFPDGFKYCLGSNAGCVAGQTCQKAPSPAAPSGTALSYQYTRVISNLATCTSQERAFQRVGSTPSPDSLPRCWPVLRAAEASDGLVEPAAPRSRVAPAAPPDPRGLMRPRGDSGRGPPRISPAAFQVARTCLRHMRRCTIKQHQVQAVCRRSRRGC